MTWTDARIAQLSELWAQGVSASGIADALGGVSRSAVLGKLHRLKLLGSRKAASAPRRFQGTAAPLSVAVPPSRAPLRGPSPTPPDPPRSPWREAAFAPLQSSRPRPWLDRSAAQCAFPVGGEGEGLICCAAPRRAGSAYCSAHHAVVFRRAGPVAAPAETAPPAAADEVRELLRVHGRAA